MSFRVKKAFLLLPVFAVLVIFFQQCARTPLERDSADEFSVAVSENLLPNPVDETSVQRYIIAIDMSWSMISGPCPQDVSEYDHYNNSSRKVRETYDPNVAGGKYYEENPENDLTLDPPLLVPTPTRRDGYFNTINYKGIKTLTGTFANDEYDHINSGIDCVVDPNMPQDYESIRLGRTRMSGVGGHGLNLFPRPMMMPPDPDPSSYGFPMADYAYSVIDGISLLPKRVGRLINQYRTYKGLDPEGKRFRLASKIIDDLSKDDPKGTRTKIMVVPISGGMAQQKLLGAISGAYPAISGQFDWSFLTPAQARVIVSLLQVEQERNYKNATDQNEEYRYEGRSMGTTAPGDLLWGGTSGLSNSGVFTYYRYDERNEGPISGSSISTIYGAVKREMIALQRTKKLVRSNFNMVFLTDGRTSPTEAQILKARDVLGCQVGFTCAYDELIQQYWGNYAENTKPKMEAILQSFLELPNEFDKEGSLRIDFLDINSYAAGKNLYATANDPDPTKAPFFADFNSTGNSAKVWTIFGDNKTNYQVGSVGRDSSALEIREMYVMNPNVRVRDSIELCVDSDGDGLCDTDEVAISLNPYAPRTFGFCLDSIYAKFKSVCDSMRAQSLCDPRVDVDSDGLNGCEESILGTNAQDFDSDDDGIPDFLAFSYGFSPSTSKAGKDTNGDGISDMVNFKAGLGPSVLYSAVPEQMRPAYSTNEILTQASNGKWVTSKELRITYLQHRSTQPILDSTAYQMTNELGQPIPLAELPFTFNQDTETNSFIVIVKMVDSTNPRNIYWYMYKNTFNIFTKELPPVIRMSEFSQIKNALDPQK